LHLRLSIRVADTETLFEAAKAPPEVYHSISGPSLAAWLARKGKNSEEQALKARLGEILRS
jgi:hypothetical protein